MRTSPNVIVTGTPGVGKTVHCEQLAQDTGLRHLSINQVAKDRDCFESYDDELGSWVIDEDKVRNISLGLCDFVTYEMIELTGLDEAPRRYRRSGPRRRVLDRLACVRSLSEIMD